jgi:hypothetical protein
VHAQACKALDQVFHGFCVWGFGHEGAPFSALRRG